MENETKRILIVDDSEDTRYLYTRYLKDSPLIIFAADSVGYGVELLVQCDEFFDLVITDLYMPGRDGFEFLEEIQTNKDIPFKPKIIVASASYLPNEFGKLDNLSHDSLITKPLNKNILKSEIERLLCIEW